MAKWELSSYIAGHLSTHTSGVDATKVWTIKHPDEKTNWDKLLDLAAEGWELVSVPSITDHQGETTQLLYTFKRPLEEGK